MQVWPKAVDCEAFSPAHATPHMRRRLAGGAPEGHGPLLLYVGRVSMQAPGDWEQVSDVNRIQGSAGGVLPVTKAGGTAGPEPAAHSMGRWLARCRVTPLPQPTAPRYCD